MLTRHCGDHFGTYTNIESLLCTSETNTVFYANYTSTKRRNLFTIVSKRIKCLGVNLTKELQNLYSKNYKTLLKDLYEWKNIP